MNDEQIEMMKALIDDGNNGSLYWIPDEHTARKIVSVGKAPTIEGEVDEPSEVAFFSNREYISLYNVDMGDIRVARPLSDFLE